MDTTAVPEPVMEQRTRACAAPLDVPSTAIWSRSDGLVNGFACRAPDQPLARDIEVRSNHVGVQLRPAVLLAIADILSGVPENAGPP